MATVSRMLMTLALSNTSHIYLFTTHITRNKIIAAVAVVAVALVAAIAWVVTRRRKTNAGQS